MRNSDHYFNVVSASGLQCSPWEITAAFPEQYEVSDDGWMTAEQYAVMTAAVQSPAIVGRIQFRDAFGRALAAQVGRSVPYTKRQTNNQMRQIGAVEMADAWPVMSIPVWGHDNFMALVGQAAQTPRRNTLPRTNPSTPTLF